MLETIIDFDLLDHAVWEDPYPLDRHLCDGAPIYYDERRDFSAITRHADFRAGLLGGEHFSSDARTYVSIWGLMPAPPGPPWESELGMGRETATSISLIRLDRTAADCVTARHPVSDAVGTAGFIACDEAVDERQSNYIAASRARTEAPSR